MYVSGEVGVGDEESGTEEVDTEFQGRVPRPKK